MAALVSTIEAGVIMLTTLCDISASIADFMYREVTRNPREAVESAIRVLGYAASRIAVGKFIEQDELRVFYKRPEELTSMTLSMLRKEVAPLRSDDTKAAELEKMMTAQNAQLAAKDALISQLRNELAGAKAGLGTQVASTTQEVDEALVQEMNRTVDQLKRTTEQLQMTKAALKEELEDLRHQVLTLNKERDELVGALRAAEAKHQRVLADLNDQVAVLQQRLEAQSAQLQQQEIAMLELRREALRPAVELIAAHLQPKNLEWDDLLVRARNLKTTSMWTCAHEVPPSAAHTTATVAVVRSSERSQLQQQQQLQQGHRSCRGATAATVTTPALEAVTPVYHAGGECRLLDQSAPAGSTTSNTRFEDIDTLYQIPKMPMGCYT